VHIDELFTSMQLDEPHLRVARNDSSIWHLYIAEPRYGSLGYLGCHDWPLLEGRYTLCVLFEYAATLGLIDVTYTDPAGPGTTSAQLGLGRPRLPVPLRRADRYPAGGLVMKPVGQAPMVMHRGQGSQEREPPYSCALRLTATHSDSCCR
jgi:hypothetical protein